LLVIVYSIRTDYKDPFWFVLLSNI